MYFNVSSKSVYFSSSLNEIQCFLFESTAHFSLNHAGVLTPELENVEKGVVQKISTMNSSLGSWKVLFMVWMQRVKVLFLNPINL